jgi:hypothetical protein
MRCLIRSSLALVTGLILFAPAMAQETSPCISGPVKGQRPGPYSSIVVLGEQRGQPHCFICETADRPAVIVFARSISEPLGKLVARLDDALLERRSDDLRVWVTFLSEDESAFAPQVLQWAKKHAVRGVPLSVFEDASGPPTYKLSRDADVTVLVSVKQKVVQNFAFRAGELSAEGIRKILEAVPQIAPAQKK